MTAMVTVVGGGAVVSSQALLGGKSGKAARISAIKGARYVLAETGGGAASGDISVKRIGKNLLIEQKAEGAEPTSLIIEDFYGSDGQLVGVGADGEYLDYQAATEHGLADAAAMSDGASSLLTLANGQSEGMANSFQFADGGSSVFSSALAGVAAVAGGFAMSGSTSNGSKAQSAPAASSFMLKDAVAEELAGEPAQSSAEQPAMTATDEVSGAANAEPMPGMSDDIVGDAAEADGADADASVVPESSVVEDANIDAELAPEAGDSKGRVRPGSPLTDGAVKAAGSVVAVSLDGVPVIDALLDKYGVVQGVIENGGYTDDGFPTIMGKAEPGVKVHVYRGKYLLGHAIADDNGEWSYVPSVPFPTGTHSITIVHQYPDSESSEQSAPYVFTVDKIPPAIPVITGIVDDKDRITGAITDQTITDDNRPTINGTGEAYAKVIIYDKGKEIGSTTVGADGKWSFTPDIPLADGVHMLSFSAMDRAGNFGQPSGVTEFVVDTRPEKINIYYADDDAGSVTGEVFSGGITDDSTPTLFGSATAGGFVKIYEGSALLGEVIAGVDGIWYFTPPALSEGAHSFHATVTLPAKGESERSKPFNLTVASVALERPSIDQVLDDVGAVQEPLKNGDSTDDKTPTLIGKADAGSTVKIYDDGKLLGSVVADANGKWTYTPSLSDGEHKFTVIATNAVGQTSPPSDVFGITVDTVPPTQIATVTDIGKDSGFSAHDYLTNDGSAGRLMQGKLSATLGAVETLQVSTDGGMTWVDALVDGIDWSAQDNNSHDKSWAIQTRVVDSAGQLGQETLQAVSLDTVAPKAPTSIVISGKQVTVGFDGGSATIGDRIILGNGSTRFEYEIKAADIAAGKAVITLPVSYGGLVAQISDSAGNISASIFNEISSGTDFENMGVSGALVVGKTYVSDGVGVTLLSGATTRNNSSHPDFSGYWLHLQPNSNMNFDLGGNSKSVRFNLGSLNNAGSTTVIFYDEHGVSLNTIKPGLGMSVVEYSAPEGKSISRFQVILVNEGAGVGIDNVICTSAQGPSVDLNISTANGSYIGTAFSDTFEVEEVVNLYGGEGHVQGGSGIDTLKLTGAGQVLDLSELVGKISSVEIFDITGVGDNTLKLSLAEVMENGRVDAFHVGDKSRVQMMVKGDTGDSVNLSDLLSNGADHGDWVKKASVVIGGVTYDTYQHSSLAAEVLLQSGVAVALDNHVQTRGFSALDIDANGAADATADTAGIHSAQSLLLPAESELFATELPLLSREVMAGAGDGVTESLAQDFRPDLLDANQVQYMAY